MSLPLFLQPGEGRSVTIHTSTCTFKVTGEETSGYFGLFKFVTFILGVFILVGQPLSIPHSNIAHAQSIVSKLSTTEFQQLVNTLSSGWNEGNAKKAASAFAEKAIYVEPPNKQLYVGREALFQFFGGDHGRPEPMQMVWHHLVFDEAQQLGVGEFTFRYGTNYQVHGTAMIKVAEGLISDWREYLSKSSLPWKEFVGVLEFQQL